MEMERKWTSEYDRAAYVDLGVGETERSREYARHCAACLGWSFDHVQGDATLLRDLLTGPWDASRFLIVPPHHTIRVTADETVIGAVPMPPST